MVKWSCASALCFNNYQSKDSNGAPILYYRLPRTDEIKRSYMRLFQTTGMNWKHGHICAAHWSKGRENASHLPDIIIPTDQYEKILDKYNTAKRTLGLYKTPNENLKLRYKKVKRKLEVANKLINQISKEKPRDPIQRNFDTPSSTRKKELSKKQYKNRLNYSLAEISKLKKELTAANAKINLLEEEIKSKNNELSKIKLTKLTNKRKISYLQNTISTTNKKKFQYNNLLTQPSLFKYLCGLTMEQFNIILKSVTPYTHLIPYPDCNVNTPTRRSTDVATELMSVLTICRHGLNQGVMAFILDKSKSTMQRIFVGWVIFLSTIFNEIDLKPASGFLLKKMPKSFIETGHGLTDIVIDATEFKFQSASNFELNSIMFSNYKNTQTGKALIGISPHGSGILFSEIYPGSINDSEITIKSGTINFVEKEHEIMSDRGFAIQEYCAEKGITLNRPKQKDSDQFSEVDVARNFDIAATRIHVERFIGRIRDWGIMNTVWPINQMDILSSTWQMLAHIVNLTMSPIGPKE